MRVSFIFFWSHLVLLSGSYLVTFCFFCPFPLCNFGILVLFFSSFDSFLLNLKLQSTTWKLREVEGEDRKQVCAHVLHSQRLGAFLLVCTSHCANVVSR